MRKMEVKNGLEVAESAALASGKGRERFKPSSRVHGRDSKKFWKGRT